MTYEGALRYLDSLGEARIRPGLDRIRTALANLGNPQTNYPVVLVGGTNGKGSTCAFLASIMGSTGRRVGLYTSPHLVRFEERIRVGKSPVPPEAIPSLVERVRSTAADLSYFEFATAMAMAYFAETSVDLAVLEVGMGGRWDATNASDPEVCVVTGIALDHTQWLGPTAAHVAREKAMIFRAFRPAVVGPVTGEALDALRSVAGDTGARLLLFGTDFTMEPDGASLSYRGPMRRVDGIRLGLRGAFQVANAACAAAAAEALDRAGLPADDQAVRDGLADARWPARLQVFPGNPSVILDCAHNPAAMEALVQDLRTEDSPIAWVYSSLRDKDASGMAQAMARAGGPVFLVELNAPRANPMAALQEAFKLSGMAATPQATLEQALAAARAAAGPMGRVVVAGSSYLAGAALRLIDPEIRGGGAPSLG